MCPATRQHIAKKRERGGGCRHWLFRGAWLAQQVRDRTRWVGAGRPRPPCQALTRGGAVGPRPPPPRPPAPSPLPSSYSEVKGVEGALPQRAGPARCRNGDARDGTSVAAASTAFASTATTVE